MSTYRLIVSTPDGHKYEGDVKELSLRGSEGDLAIMAGHIPFATVVKQGDIRIVREDDSQVEAKIGGGMLVVGESETVLLCGEFEEGR